MKFKFLLVIALVFSASVFAQTVAPKPKPAYPFEDEIIAYKKKDSIAMPKPGGILFIGSSSIRMWADLPKQLPKLPLTMRGVGGSTIAQWVQYFMPSIVYPYKPSKIFIYVGDNDIAAGGNAQGVYDNFVTLLSMIKTELPNAKVYFMSLKLSPSRAKFYSEVALADVRIEGYIKTQQNVQYIDVNSPLFNTKSLPDSVYFKPDMLHLKPNGYEKWLAAILPYLNK